MKLGPSGDAIEMQDIPGFFKLMVSLNPLIDSIKVTSVLRDDFKSYGKQFLLDGREDTCWNSDSGLPQSIYVTFKADIKLERLDMMFQGGFVGIECEILCNDQVILTIFPKDINDLQSFILSDHCHVDISKNSNLELKFKQSSDFYGRVTIYMIHFDGMTYND